VSGGGETTEGGSRETDEGRRRATEAKKGGQHLSSRSRSTGNGRAGTKEELVEGDESGTSGVSSIQGGDEFDQTTPFDEETMSPLSPQGDSEAALGAGRNGDGVGNRAHRYR